MNKENRRVVITGLGVISPIGNDVETFEKNLMAGKCGISELDFSETPEFRGINVKVAAIVKDFNPAEHGLTPHQVRRTDRFAQYALAATKQALEMSGLKSGVNIEPERLGVYIGSGIGGMETFIKQTRVMLEDGAGFISPLFIPMLIANIGGANVAIEHNAKGPALTCVSACATGTNAIGEAFYAIQRGDADAIITGGSEYTINPLAFGSFQNAKALSLEPDPLKACLPFDKKRSGFVMGDGAGIMIIEEYNHAVARGANIIAEICGYGNTCDAHHVTAPAPDGISASRAIRKALDEADFNPEESLYINAHGTGTRLNDTSETRAIKIALGEETAHKAIISSTKSMTGHMLGAVGALELVICALVLRDGIIPPTIGLTEPDDECDLDYTPLKARKADVDIAISNSLGFGGHNVAVALRKYHPSKQ
ncbi:MAG: beta-ketoacyl-ACP synthase II [Bacteroidales bacterium]|nr:beta-ketoacyl-ACP synthase II [Bacteroidales bacterium]